MAPVSEKQIAAILALPPPQRYDHFIKKVVGWRKLWGLFDDGWAMSESGDSEPVFPLWPEKEYAQLCATADWAGYQAKEIELEESFRDRSRDRHSRRRRESGIAIAVIGEDAANQGAPGRELATE